MGQNRVSHAPVTPLNTPIKPARPITPFRTTQRCISLQSTNSDSSTRSPRSSTPGLTESLSCCSSAPTSPVSTPRSDSPFQSPRICTLTTTLLQSPSSSPTIPNDSSGSPIHAPSPRHIAAYSPRNTQVLKERSTVRSFPLCHVSV